MAFQTGFYLTVYSRLFHVYSWLDGRRKCLVPMSFVLKKRKEKRNYYEKNIYIFLYDYKPYVFTYNLYAM